MGVLTCQKIDCENIMCDRYSYEYGYICNECFDALIEEGPSVNISEWLATERKTKIPKVDLRIHFDKIFPVQR